MRLTRAGSAALCFKQEDWGAARITNGWALAQAEVATNAAALARARELLQKPCLDNKLDYAAGIDMKFEHLIHPKELARWFGVSAQISLREGNTTAAVEDLIAQIRTMRWLEKDDILIGELVRIAILGISRARTWETLQVNDGWQEDDLERLQRAWETPEVSAAMSRCLEGERIYVRAAYDQMRKSNERAVQCLFWEDAFASALGAESEQDDSFVGHAVRFFRNQVYCRVWRLAWLDQSELRHTRFLQQLIEISREAAQSKSWRECKPKVEGLQAGLAAGGFYQRLRFWDDISVAAVAPSIKRFLQAETERSLVVAAIALKRHHLKYGRYPEKLSELIPGFLGSLPVDFMNGKPLGYSVGADGLFKLYSVGEDCEDNGGDGSRTEDQSSGAWGRKDMVWPRLATAAEVEETSRKN
jgi:hypothetical protein